MICEKLADFSDKIMRQNKEKQRAVDSIWLDRPLATEFGDDFEIWGDSRGRGRRVIAP